ncbi:hypothetical protein ES708_33388 [subsurface metagenome]
MRNKILILIPIVLLALALVGCIPGITPTPEPEPVSEMEAVALAELVAVYDGDVVDYWTIVWSIVNVGDVFIREYTLIFKVDYPDVPRDYIVIEETGEYLEVGTMHSGETVLLPYDLPKSVSVRWELSE